MAEQRHEGVSRREVMRRTLKAGVYAAPVILSASALAPVVAAATPPGGVIAYLQDAALTDVGALATFDVTYTPLNALGVALAAAAPLGSFVTDRFGVGGGAYPLTLDTTVVKAVLVTFTLRGAPLASGSATSQLVSAVAPVNGVRPPARLVGLVFQEPTVAACQIGPLTSFTETVDVALINAQASTAYDIYVQPNGVATPVKVGSLTTSGDGNGALFLASPVVTVGAVPTSVVVSAVLAGAPATPPLYTLTASGGKLLTIGCASLQHPATGTVTPVLISVR